VTASRTVGVLHPGEMGSVVGACALAAGARVLWASEGRGRPTRERATTAGFEEAGTLAALVRAADVILSVCPPHAAVAVARSVAGERFTGIYVDANAVAPATAREIGAIVEKAGAAFADGGIIGPPPIKAGTTRLYLSGTAAPRVADVLVGTPLEVIVLGGNPGLASAIKMAYAAWTKGSAALLMAIRALAVAEGVDAALLAEWARSQPDLGARTERAAATSARKACRWVGEMEEIAAGFATAGLPEGFHQAAAEIFRRLEAYKDAPTPPSIDAVAGKIARPSAGHSL
jgi:3-hydroxyisobutyrate dehydrogenase-like beta-hydroxyacid dehydrogenase